MQRLVKLLVVPVLIISGCGSDDSGSPVTNAEPAVSVTAGSQETDTSPSTGSGSASQAGERSPSGVDGPAAPDFSLVLGDGSTFTLSEGTKPVYIVFWAEW